MIHSPDPRAVKDALQALSHVIHEEVLFNAFFSYLIGILESGQFNDNFVRVSLAFFTRFLSSFYQFPLF